VSDIITLCDGQQVRMGRIRPYAQADTPRFKMLVASDGTQRIIPKLEAYADLTMASPPVTVDLSAKAMATVKRKYANDQYGDCVIAGKAHQIGIWTGNDSDQAVEVSDNQVVSSYHSICGPGDNGCNITAVLDVFKQSGLWGHKIDGYVEVNHTNKLLVQTAIYLLGSLTLGINLPHGWTCTNCVWGPSSGSVGGHDVCVVGYGPDLKDANGKPFNEDGVAVATWGGIALIPWPQFLVRSWVEECYAELSPDWYGKDNLAPNGIDAGSLKNDLDVLGGGTPPPLPDPIHYLNPDLWV